MDVVFCVCVHVCGVWCSRAKRERHCTIIELESIKQNEIRKLDTSGIFGCVFEICKWRISFPSTSTVDLGIQIVSFTWTIIKWWKYDFLGRMRKHGFFSSIDSIFHTLSLTLSRSLALFLSQANSLLCRIGQVLCGRAQFGEIWYSAFFRVCFACFLS